LSELNQKQHLLWYQSSNSDVQGLLIDRL